MFLYHEFWCKCDICMTHLWCYKYFVICVINVSASYIWLIFHVCFLWVCACLYVYFCIFLVYSYWCFIIFVIKCLMFIWCIFFLQSLLKPMNCKKLKIMWFQILQNLKTWHFGKFVKIFYTLKFITHMY